MFVPMKTVSIPQNCQWAFTTFWFQQAQDSLPRVVRLRLNRME